VTALTSAELTCVGGVGLLQPMVTDSFRVTAPPTLLSLLLVDIAGALSPRPPRSHSAAGKLHLRRPGDRGVDGRTSPLDTSSWEGREAGGVDGASSAGAAPSASWGGVIVMVGVGSIVGLLTSIVEVDWHCSEINFLRAAKMLCLHCNFLG